MSIVTIVEVDSYFDTDDAFETVWDQYTAYQKQEFIDRAETDLSRLKYVGTEVVSGTLFPRTFATIEGDMWSDYYTNNASIVPQDFKNAVSEQCKFYIQSSDFDIESFVNDRFGSIDISSYNVSIDVNRNGYYSRKAMYYLDRLLVKPRIAQG